MDSLKSPSDDEEVIAIDSLKSPSDDEEVDLKPTMTQKRKYNTQLAYPVLMKFIHESLAKF